MRDRRAVTLRHLPDGFTRRRLDRLAVEREEDGLGGHGVLIFEDWANASEFSSWLLMWPLSLSDAVFIDAVASTVCHLGGDHNHDVGHDLALNFQLDFDECKFIGVGIDDVVMDAGGARVGDAVLKVGKGFLALAID